jgi:Carbohydrate-binding module 48 (Isoamylase N-terminal domain)
MSLTSEGRLHFAGNDIGAWLGAGFGGLGTRSSSGPITIADIGAWGRLGPAMITMSLTRSAFQSNDVSALPTLTASDVFNVKTVELGSRDRRLYDLMTTLHWERGILELDATGGARLPSRTDDFRRWGSLGVGVWISKSAALVVRGGSDPANATYGFPSVRYASIGLRLTTPSSRARPVARSTAASGSDFMLLSGAENLRTLRVVAPGARRVELMGDFTEWNTVPLEQVAKDTWETTLHIDPGTYRLSVRLDGGAWGPPPGIPSQSDEFNGVVGVVVVR